MPPDDEQPADKPDPKVKELLERDLGKPLREIVDDVTAAELERWFALPTFQQVTEGEVKVAEDADMLAARERSAKAIAAIDPTLVEALRRRTDGAFDGLLKFKANITLRVNPDLALFDHAMVENKLQISEPREIERPHDIEQQMEDATPQALLRDLHRPELAFEKLFEVVDMAAAQRLDIVAEVRDAMSTSWKLPAFGIRPGIEARQLLAEIHAERRLSWADIPNRAQLSNRTVQE